MDSTVLLPIKVNSPKFGVIENEYTLIGIKVIDKYNELFYNCQLPEGWLLKDDNHYWTKVLDEKGRERANIFAKLASYDSDAFINFKQRIRFEVDRIGFLNSNYSKLPNGKYVSESTDWEGRVFNSDGEILYETGITKCDVEYNIVDGKEYGYTEEYNHKVDIIKTARKAQCIDWLENNYPEYESFDKYWDK